MTKDNVKNDVFLSEDKIDNVADKTIEEYAEFSLKERVVFNGLVGDLIAGEYVISDELKQLFVVNKKLLIKREENFLIAKMERLGKTFKFKLLFEDFDKVSMIAELYIIEELDGKTIETFIANYIDVKDYEFKQKAREVFNILLEEDEYAKDDDEDFDALDAIINRNKKARADDRIFVLETYSELYIIEMLNALSEGGALSKKVLEQYKEEVKKRGLLNPNVPHVYIKLKNILDDVMEKNGGIKEIACENKKTRKAMERYIVPVIDFEKTAKAIENLGKKTEGIKEDAPKKSSQLSKGDKSGAKKSSSKAKSGGGGKKSGNKKSAKKKEEKKEDKKKRGGVITFVPVFTKRDTPEKEEKKPSVQAVKPATTVTNTTQTGENKKIINPLDNGDFAKMFFVDVFCDMDTRIDDFTTPQNQTEEGDSMSEEAKKKQKNDLGRNL